MADKVILDFENNMITWDTDVQKGTEYCPDLAERKKAVLTAMGYETVNFSPIVKSVESFLGGEISKDELLERFEKIKNE